MPTFDLNQLLTLLSILLAATVLPPSGRLIVLAFAVGVLTGDKLRKPPA